ncbi:MAG: SDR family oxidoreductase, partial [Acidimicrobiales bacterium]
MRIAAALRGKRFFVTGGTGFLGTALVERILRTVPDAEVVVLVRPGRRASAAERTTREILRNDCFDRLRRELGDRFEQAAHRVIALPGDVSRDGLGLDEQGLRLLASCDIVVHSAATVSFDAPLDQAVEINLLGPARVAAALESARAAERRAGEVHLIAVSTAYVAGTHQGEAREELLTGSRFSLDVDWRAEVDYARRLRQDLETESRRAATLVKFAKKSRAELGAAGSHLLAARAERLRDEWVKDRLVDAGSARAQSLGWPDAYPFTKALGERCLTESVAVPLTIVRPSIIESALAEPVPGWIRGFRMAEPIIISLARGLLREFPGVPEGVIDVIPVDMVVAAILAIAAAPPPTQPSVYHVASGVANPLRYGRLVELIQDWFARHPIYDDRGQPISIPEWSFPGRGRVQRQLQRATKAMDAAERLLTTLPLRGRQASFSASIEVRNTLAKRALGYVELYGAYTETEARYRVDRLLGIWSTLDARDQSVYCFDPSAIDWNRYVHEIHLPSIVAHARVKTTPG